MRKGYKDTLKSLLEVFSNINWKKENLEDKEELAKKGRENIFDKNLDVRSFKQNCGICRRSSHIGKDCWFNLRENHITML